MESLSEIASYLMALVRDEVVVHGLRYLVVGGLALIGYLIFGPRYKERIAALETELADLKQGRNNKAQEHLAGERNTIGPAPDVPLVSPAPAIKTPCPLTLKELVTLTASRDTELEKGMLFAPLQNTWIRVQGTVEDIVPSFGGESVDIEISLPDDVNVDLWMNEELYTAKDFVGLKKGDSFTAEGKFDSASEYGRIYLEKCERVN